MDTKVSALWHIRDVSSVWSVLLPTGIIRFAPELDVAIGVTLGSRTKVLEVLEMLERFESTRFQDLLDTWRDRTIRSIDFHPGQTGRGAYYI